MKTVFILCVLVAVVFGTPDKPLESEDIINHVNNVKTTWKAGRNFDPKLTRSYIKNLLGLKRKNRPNLLPLKEPVLPGKIPKNFDARTQWPNCISLQEIRDQGDCGSCWAVGAASAFTDRLCVATNGDWNGHLSAEDLMTCCTNCGFGCNGGYDDSAWSYFQENGIVTGGDFGSKEGCQPYKKKPCEHHVNGTRPQCSELDPSTPKCKTKCIKKYKTKYNKDLKKVSSAYYLNDVTQVQQDILTNGPMEAGFDVYADFLSYKSGVYQHTTGDYLGGHAVKVIGWGVEKKVPYWLVANSWNYDWGDNGFFKIKRGSNECGFENDMSGGLVFSEDCTQYEDLEGKYNCNFQAEEKLKEDLNTTFINVGENTIFLRLYHSRRNDLRFYKDVAIKDSDSLSIFSEEAGYNPNLPSVFYTHGFLDTAKRRLSKTLSSAFLTRGDYNVFNVDWSHLNQPPYTQAVHNLKLVGVAVAKFLQNAIEKKLIKTSDINLIGHSLGAHLSGYIGRNLGKRPPVIVGLDPAGPGFISVVPAVMLTYLDADYVNYIHTNRFVYGTAFDLGHANYKFNGASVHQPGCVTSVCSHLRAVKYFAEAVANPGTFVAIHCDSRHSSIQNSCNGSQSVIGFPVDKWSNGTYVIKTNNKEPYGKGQEGAQPQEIP